METNQTLLNDIFNNFPKPSTPTFKEGSPPARDMLIGDLPHMDLHNVTVDSINSRVSSNHMLSENFLTTIESIVDESAWLLYTIAGVVTLAVIIVIIAIVVSIIKYKKRVIQQDNDPILASVYNNGPNWGGCCLCSVKVPGKQSQLRNRQNSVSNLDPYRRPPLPSSVGTKNAGPYNGTFNHIEALNTSSVRSMIDGRNLAVNIQSIRGVPHVNLRPEKYRNLPPLKMRYG